MDNLNERRPQDTSRISLNEKWEVKYWCRELGVSEDELRVAVLNVGNDAQKVKKYIQLSQSA
jgi:hypothetical protein